MRILLSSFVLVGSITSQLTCPNVAISQDSPGEKSPFNILSSKPETQIAVGEWGEIESHEIVLEPSDFYFTTSFDFINRSTETIWRFNSSVPETVKQTLINSGLAPELATKLVSPRFLTRNETLNVLEVSPPEEVILGMDSSQRWELYQQLWPKSTTNPYYKPFSLPVGGIDAVAHIPTGLPEAQIERIRQVSFLDGRKSKFSDLNFLMKYAADDHERLRILKTISREKSLTVRLNLSEYSNARELSKYWESSGRNKDVVPILESVIRTSGIDHLDIAHLLPPTPRKLLHTYPSPQGEGLADDMPDCFWTAFGFFSDVPPDRHLDFVGHVFNERYERAEKPLQFGDLIVFSQKGGTQWIHACNHIAADLVFTKNGMSMGRPWVISPFKTVVDTYLSKEGITVAFFRLKPEYQR